MTQAPSNQAVASSEPTFQHVADELALQMAAYSPEELQSMLKVNPAIARETWQRYQDFHDPVARTPAAWAYDGMVFKKLAPETLSPQELTYANNHLFIASFLYGLLRPLDLINPYRLEGNIELPSTGGKSLFSYWRPQLTDFLINTVNTDDGILVNLASNEFKGMLDWKRVVKETTVVTPEFKIDKDGRLKTVVIYAKMCRGAMARWILEHRPARVEQLQSFEYEGFKWAGNWNYILQSLS